MMIDPERPPVLQIPGLLTAQECQLVIDLIDASAPSVAPISTASGPVHDTDIRNNERVMFDKPELAQLLYERVRPHAPATCHGMRLVGANERLRCYRYRPGMRFALHRDGSFHRSDDERSLYTFLIYLNEGCQGGHTRILLSPPVSVAPQTGMALLFQHWLLHEGAEVTEGVKYVLRSDLMYRR